jgi:hypothetical protein
MESRGLSVVTTLRSLSDTAGEPHQIAPIEQTPLLVLLGTQMSKLQTVPVPSGSAKGSFRIKNRISKRVWEIYVILRNNGRAHME